MSFLDYFRKKTSASIAKERLQIIVAHERGPRQRAGDPSYLADLKNELIKVITKYVHVNEDAVNVTLERDDERSVLELNVSLPEKEGTSS